jgi:hypothetical protein
MTRLQVHGQVGARFPREAQRLVKRQQVGQRPPELVQCEIADKAANRRAEVMLNHAHAIRSELKVQLQEVATLVVRVLQGI